MIALPSVERFVEVLETEHGAKRLELPVQLYGPRGPATITVMMREVEGKTRFSDPLPDTPSLPWQMFDRVCRQLGLDHKDVIVGAPRPPQWWERPEQ